MVTALFNKFGKLRIFWYAFCNYWGDGVQLLGGGIYTPSPCDVISVATTKLCAIYSDSQTKFFFYIIDHYQVGIITVTPYKGSYIYVPAIPAPNSIYNYILFNQNPKIG